MTTIRQCVQCGKPLAANRTDRSCPACASRDVIALEATHASGVGGQVGDPREVVRRADAIPVLGESFGGYRVARLLGRGGMGAVFEAEHTESGRRVALKVLSRALDTESEKRFLREGRLAASVNHPNSVYVFGTEEIRGTPVIAMEFVGGGTLQDRVSQRGPLPVTEAVDAILQIIAGLESAASVNVLHRDIKPSNCFVDASGAVKIGDFGLSISQKARGDSNLTQFGAFMGTPAFCSPEQLRGDELDERSDIYAVGMTLYYLLTGRTAFESENMVRMVAIALAEPPPSPREFRPDTPERLAQIILRCLEKKSGARYANYASLRAQLLPFSSATPTSAPLNLRFAAGLVDILLLWLPLAIYWTYCQVTFEDLPAIKTSRLVIATILFQFGSMLYFSLLEGFGGASLGKALCRLRVVGVDRDRATLPKAMLRAFLFVIVPAMPHLVMSVQLSAEELVAVKTHTSQAFTFYLSGWVLTALWFATARGKNGFAALHDFGSGTRVILKPSAPTRPVLTVDAASAPPASDSPAIGPYSIQSRHETSDGELIVGYDQRLHRTVWICSRSPTDPPVSSHRRDLSRPGRVRWLMGKRGPTESWDAYEAPAGKPLLALLDQPQPWERVRFWLLDLAEELRANRSAKSEPLHTGLDHVWITTDGRAKLLDFPAPNVVARQPPFVVPDEIAARQFLNQLAMSALEGHPVNFDEAHRRNVRAALPLYARKFMAEEMRFAQELGEILRLLRPLLEKPAAITRWRRFSLLLGCVLPPTMLATMIMGIMVLLSNQAQIAEEAATLDYCLQRYETTASDLTARDERRMLEFYIARRYRSLIKDPIKWPSTKVSQTIQPARRALAERLVTAHSQVADKEFADATKVLKPFLDQAPGSKSSIKLSNPIFFGGSIALAMLLFVLFVVLPSLLAAPLFAGGPLCHLLRIAVVTPDGADASRRRIFVRTLLAWSPILLMVVLIPVWVVFQSNGWVLVDSILGFLFLSGAIAALWRPDRSLQDRIARTILVPR